MEALQHTTDLPEPPHHRGGTAVARGRSCPAWGLLNVTATRSPAWVEALFTADRPQRVDLTAPRLVRYHLIRAGLERHPFVLTLHHAMIDGWSLSLLLGELFDLPALGADDRTPLPSLTAALRSPRPTSRTSRSARWRTSGWPRCAT
ncbi:condensation domain-containing protein [Lentzea roselyniae]|uniref:condensation domain-containing protein n=1 Tax=Lentzea roselyniae TaxID=531940 RepID=UPI003D15696A